MANKREWKRRAKNERKLAVAAIDDVLDRARKAEADALDLTATLARETTHRTTVQELAVYRRSVIEELADALEAAYGVGRRGHVAAAEFDALIEKARTA